LWASVEKHGLHADAITTDAARILRIAGTHNRKPAYGTPRMSKVLFPENLGEPVRHDLDEILRILQGQAGIADNVVSLPTPPATSALADRFARLSLEERDELLDYALSVIAEKTPYLKQTKDGGSYDIWFRLGLSCARSGAPNAENIWVKYASRVPDAAPEDK